MSEVPGLRDEYFKVELKLWVYAPSARAAAISALMNLRDMSPAHLPNVRVSTKANPESVEIDPGSMSDTGGWDD